MIPDLPDHLLGPLTLLTATGATDAYGAQTAGNWIEQVGFRGRIEHSTRVTDSTTTGGRRADASEWLLLTVDARVAAHDRIIDAAGRTFTVSGTPAPRVGAFDVGHIEATLILVDG